MSLKKFSELSEARGDTAVFCIGRFNPPTTGHELMIESAANIQSKYPGAKFYVFPTHSQDPQKNPLPHALKVAYMKKMFKKYARNIQVSKARNVFEMATLLHDKGHRAIVLVAGSDRVDEFEKLLNQYNGVKGKHGYYGFDSIEVISAGERDPDSEGVSGMSASKVRAAASQGDYDSFKQGLPTSFKDGVKLYNDVRKHMGIREERDMGKMDDYETLRDAYLTGKIWNIDDLVEANGIEGRVVNRGTNYIGYMDGSGKVHKAWLHDIALNERNYAKEYANYAGRPEQIARRSSRNKARRAMGDKAVKGMDVGHRDNNPLNNDPKNLRNEDPSVNRREPRLREGPEEIKKLEKMLKDLEKKKRKTPGDGFAKMRIKELIADLKSKKEEVELDELSSPIPWLNKAAAKISQASHPKGWEKVAKEYVNGMKDPEHRKHPSAWASEVAQGYRGIEARDLVNYINMLVKKGQLPKELKAEYVPEQMSFKDLVSQIQEGAYGYERQDPDVKDKEGTQPAKYHKGLSKSTKQKRDAHFKKKKSGPAPGDADAETKPSEYTKKFKQMYGEALPKNADMGDYIDDFQKSDSPQFKGKSEKKRKEMAIAAYLSKQRNESVDDLQHPKVDEKPVDHLSGDWQDINVPAPAENSSEETLKELMVIKKLSENRTKEEENSIKEHDMAVTWSIRNYLKENDLEYDTDVMSKIVHTGQGLSRHFKNKFLRPRPFQLAKELDMDLEPMDFPSDSMKTPSYPSGHSLQSRLVAEFYVKKYPEHKKGLIAAAEECGLGRVKAGWHYPSDHKSGVMIAEAAAPMIDSTIEEDSPCWAGFKQVGMKKKNGKNVPNCVPEEFELNEKVEGLVNKSEKSGISYSILKKVYDRGLAAYKTGHRPGTTAPQWAFARVNSFITGGGARKSDNDLWKQHKEEFNEWGEIEEKAEYQGRKVTLNKPFYTPDGPKKSAVYVTGPKGDPVIVRFGDKKMEIKVDDPERRKSFRARHNCDNPGPKWKARYWSCKAW